MGKDFDYTKAEINAITSAKDPVKRRNQFIEKLKREAEPGEDIDELYPEIEYNVDDSLIFKLEHALKQKEKGEYKLARSTFQAVINARKDSFYDK